VPEGAWCVIDRSKMELVISNLHVQLINVLCGVVFVHVGAEMPRDALLSP